MTIAANYILNSSAEQRRELERLVKSKLVSANLVSSEGFAVHITKSGYMHAFNEATMSTPKKMVPVDGNVSVDHYLEFPSLVIEVLNSIFDENVPGLPDFLWKLVKPIPVIERICMARIVKQVEPHHWFVPYELKMQTPDGELNGVHGSILEMRIDRFNKPIRIRGVNPPELIYLLIRFPLFGTKVDTIWNEIWAPKPDSHDVKFRDGAHDHSTPEKQKAKPNSKLILKPQKLLGIKKLVSPYIASNIKNEKQVSATAQKKLAFRPVYVLPCAGANLLGLFYRVGEGQVGQYLPATPESSRIFVEQTKIETGVSLEAFVAPSKHHDWQFACYYAGSELGKLNQPVNKMVSGNKLTLPEGSFEVDIVATRFYKTGRGS